MYPDDWLNSTSPFKRDASKGLFSPPDETVGIIIPMRDGIPFFKLALHSVLSFTDHPYMLVVVDNMSAISTKKALRKIEHNHPVTVLRYDHEFNFAAQINLGARYLFQQPSVKYALALNADCVVEPFWLSRMVETMGSDSRTGLVGPVSNVAIPEQEGGRVDRAGADETTRLSGLCLLFRRETFEQVGGFDEDFIGGCFEDWDFCERARARDWRCVVNRGVYIHHFGHAYRRNHTDSPARTLANRERFFAKHPKLKPKIEEALML